MRLALVLLGGLAVAQIVYPDGLQHLATARFPQDALHLNVSRCVLYGHNSTLCAALRAFNLSACLHTHKRHPALPRLPTAAASCMLASGCFALWDVAPCVGPFGFNLTDHQFNYTACQHLFASANVTLPPNATGCEGLLPLNLTNATVTAAVEEEEEEEKERLPRFTPCVGAHDQEKLRRMDFMSAFKDYVHFMVTAVSPNDGPVTGGTSVAVCGMGFRLTNENVNHLKCRFTDGHHTKARAPPSARRPRACRCSSLQSRTRPPQPCDQSLARARPAVLQPPCPHARYAPPPPPARCRWCPPSTWTRGCCGARRPTSRASWWGCRTL